MCTAKDQMLRVGFLHLCAQLPSAVPCWGCYGNLQVGIYTQGQTLSLQGQMHLLNALIVPCPPSQWGMFRTRDELVLIPLAQYSQGE